MTLYYFFHNDIIIIIPILSHVPSSFFSLCTCCKCQIFPTLIFLAARLESPLDVTNCIIHTLNLLFTSSSTRSIINSVTPKFKFKLIRFIYFIFFFFCSTAIFVLLSIRVLFFIYCIDNTNIFIQPEIN